MLIEASVYANRWRQTAPEVKAVFALMALAAAFAASTPLRAALIAGALVLVLCLGARVRWTLLCRAVWPPLLFLLPAVLPLACSLDFHEGASLHWLPLGWTPVLQLLGRSTAALLALLFLALTTPMGDLIALLRRAHVSETLLDIMVLCYRSLFVLTSAWHDIRTAQTARLGDATPRHSLRSLGALTASLTLQVWQRSHDLHRAAQSRNQHGPFRFLAAEFPPSRRALTCAVLGGLALLALAQLPLQ